MKKLYVLFWLCVAVCGAAQANPIDEANARQVGSFFLRQQAAWRGGAVLTLNRANPTQIANPEFYAFNCAGGMGFVVVAGDDEVTPVLGYSDQSAFDAAHLPDNMAKWLEGYRQEIRAVRANHPTTPADVTAAWLNLRGNGQLAQRGTTAVAPLVQTHWNQSPYYNALCPYDNNGGGRSVSGCVATAMVQVMKYWNYPTVGAGFHSYNTSQYGTLSANFGATTYQWAS